VADLVAIRNALAANITALTGLRADGQARDSITPPCAVVLPGNPYITYGVTMDGPVMGGPVMGNAVNISLGVLVIIGEGAPVDATQRALDAYLGVGVHADVAASVPNAIESDPSLGGLIDFIQAQTVTQYGRIEYSGVTYFGARINVIAGGM
jgi:hypothetical protein